MNTILLLILFLILLIRLCWLLVYNNSSKIGFLLPLFLECIFIYPYLIVDALGLYWSFTGLSTLYILILSFQLGLYINKSETNKRVTFLLSNKVYFFIGILLFFNIVAMIVNHKGNILGALSVSRIFEIANQNAIDRYSGALQLGFLYKISTIFSFSLAFIFGAVLATKSEFKTKLLFTIYILLLLLDSVMMAARAGLLLQLAAVSSSYFLIKYMTEEQGYFRVNATKLKTAILGLVILFLFFVVIQVFRGGKEEFDILAISSHVLTWFIGYIPAFDVWISDNYAFELTLGGRTFAGLADLFNILTRSGGVYEAVNIGEGRVSNVYTVFRGLIEDFSIMGASLILLTLGLLFVTCLNRVLNSSQITLPFLFLNMVVYFFFWSFVINPFIYNSILLAFFIYAVSFKYFFNIRC